MKVIYPDEKVIISSVDLDNPKTTNIFLAGTIDNGNSKDWQKEFIDELKEVEIENNINITVFNPRIKKWNSKPSKEDLEFQIKWEQDHLDKADLIIMVLSDNSKSAISLLELGLYAEHGNIMAFCTDKFYRFVNVRLICEKYIVLFIKSTDTKDIIKEIKNIYQ